MKKETNSFKLKDIELNKIANDDLFLGSFKAYFSTYYNVNLRPDRMLKGCFDSEIARFKGGAKLPRLFVQHDATAIPGIIENIYDDEVGAIVEGKFINTNLGRDTYVAFKSGAIDELSFAFYVIDSEIDREGVRNVKRVEGIEEISIVTWGMDPKTKPIEINNKELTIRDAEEVLHNAGFSQKQTKTILARGFNFLNRDDSKMQRDAEETIKNGLDNLLNILRKD